MGFINQIKVTSKILNCRLEPSYNGQILNTIQKGEIYNVVTEQNGWGQLENGSWINLQFTVPVEYKEHKETNISVEEAAEVVKAVEAVEAVKEPITEAKTEMIEKQPEVVVDEVIDVTAHQDKIALHKVKKKESLWDVAEFWYGKGSGDRYVEIKEFNNLQSDILRAGMTLKIPNLNV